MADRHDIDEIRELLPPYALQELDAVDRTRVESALGEDPVLRSELDEIELLSARVVSGVPHVAAPAALKGRVLDAVRAGSQRPVMDSSPTVATVSDLARPRRSRERADAARRRWLGAPLLAGGLAAACLVLVAVAFNLSGDLDDARLRAQQLEGTARDAESPAGLEGASTLPVGTTGPLSDSGASLIKVSDEKWILVVDDMPSPGEGNTWQVWTAHDNGQVRNIAHWDTGDTKRILVIDSADINEVMISHEKSTAVVPAPSIPPVADIKV